MLSRARYVAVVDEVGHVVSRGAPEGGPPPPTSPAMARDLAPADPLWRAQALQAQGRELGHVVWSRGRPDEDRLVEATVHVLVDLGAAAISRARISAEHARLEVVAEAEQLRRALLASVSHDLRTPLAGILGSATSLLDHSDKYDERIRRDLLANIREQAHRLNRYIENLLGMTRLESGTLQPKLQPVPLEALVLEAWETIADNAGPTRPKLEIEEDLEVLADPVLLRQVLWNLLENAVKFSPSGSKIEVRARLVGEAVKLRIVDQGPGLPEEELEQLFEPFVRGRKAKGSGFGLGLFIARSFLEAMGASIAARSSGRGRSGLTFELTLPKAANVEAAA
jgi:two-component system sensor histidine kinase KdpD